MKVLRWGTGAIVLGIILEDSKIQNKYRKELDLNIKHQKDAFVSNSENQKGGKKL